MECENRVVEDLNVLGTEVEENGKDGEDDVPQLPSDTLAALQEFYDEQETIRKLLERNLTTKDDKEGNDETTAEESEQKLEGKDGKGNELFEIDLNKAFPEDWQLSQFWYDEETSNTLADEVLKQAGNGSVACISCPSIFRACKNAHNVTLFEYDKRFKAFGSSYHFYDYNKPEDIPKQCLQSFSVVIADPPFLSEECLEKVALTVKNVAQENAKIILCTGAVMEPHASRLLNLKRSPFVPTHKNNLGNEFGCFTNYEMKLDR